MTMRPFFWNLVRPSVSKKLGGLVAIFLLLAVINFSVLSAVLLDTRGAGQAINVASRLRLISQRIPLAAQAVDMQDEQAEQQLSELLVEFDAGLFALEHGGPAYGWQVPPPAHDLQPALQTLRLRWQPLRAAVVSLRRLTVDSHKLAATLDEVDTRAASILSATDAVVRKLTALSAVQESRNRWGLDAIVLVDLILLAVAYVAIRRFFVRPILAAVTAARGLAAGDHTVRIPYQSKDEVGDLVQAFNQMADQVAGYVALLEKEKKSLERTDSLTGLLNRSRLLTELERYLGELDGQRHGSFLFLDLDQFKYINDSLGHQAGDQLLASLATLMRARLPAGSLLARFGGDEFAVFLKEVDAERARRIAEQLLEAIAQHQVVFAGRPIRVTASMGLAHYPAHAASAQALLMNADMAMHRAKKRGRNAVVVYEAGSDEQAMMGSKLTWEWRIREALQQDRFVLVAQPILHVASGEVTQHEALLRMIGEQGEIIPPGQFLDVAERFGLIHAIDRMVVQKAIRLIAAHAQAGQRLCLEVNLSGKAFADPELLPLIQQELAETGIDPTLLVLEITETAAIAEMGHAGHFIDTLRSLGCRFALDDFGVGFTSFAHLKHLPVDYLKIDGSFIRNLCTDLVDQQLVRAMVEVARGLGKRTVAEFVGDALTVDLLREYGVDFAQGYYIGQPTPLPLPPPSEVVAHSLA